tara:strand:+ start:2468 stop:3151 length:684 start_codon:yes stop_codon:yes gene_type:complete
MNWVDYGIIAIILLSALIGVMRGFVREVFGLGTWALAFILAIAFGPQFADSLSGSIATPLLRTGIAYGGLFLGGLLIGGILTAVLVARIRESRFSSVDRTTGAGIGLLRGVLLVGLAVLLGSTAGMSAENWWSKSKLIEPATVVADGFKVVIPESWLDPLKPDSVPRKDAEAAAELLPHLAPGLQSLESTPSPVEQQSKMQSEPQPYPESSTLPDATSAGVEHKKEI